MSEEEKDAERLTEVEKNESEPPSPPPLESDQSAIEAKANVAEDQELKVLPETGEEEQKEIIVAADAAKKSLPRATTTTTTPIGKRKKQQLQKQQQKQQQKEISITNVPRQLERQATEIKKIKSIVQSQPQLIKQLQSQLKQLQKQILQIQKYVGKKKKK